MFFTSRVKFSTHNPPPACFLDQHNPPLPGSIQLVPSHEHVMTSCRACTYEFGSRGEALLKLGHPSPRTHPTFPPPSKQGRPAHQTCTLKQWLGPAILCVCVRVWSSVWLSAPPAGTRSACSQPPAPSSGAPPAAACLWSPSAPSSAQSTRSAACSARQSSYGDKDAQTDRQTDRPTETH